MGSKKTLAHAVGVVALGISLGISWGPPQTGSAQNATQKIDKVIVLKSARVLQLLRGGEIVKTFKISLGKDPKGPKTQHGDGKTPEGNYVLDYRNARSQFHRSIHISYPSATDKERARKLGLSPGGDIFVHGLPNGLGWIGRAHLLRDWTDGCIAVTNAEIEEFWRLVPDGTPIEIKP